MSQILLPDTRIYPPNCPLCGSRPVKKIAVLSGLSIVRCKRCKLTFVHPQPRQPEAHPSPPSAYYDGLSLAQYVDYYAAFRRRVFQSSCASLECHLGATSFGKGRPSVLDIGCSFGWFLEVAKGRGWQVAGLEPSVEAAAYARTHSGAVVHTGGAADIDRIEDDFDAVTLWNVLEHLPDPLATLAAVRGKLKPRGVLGLAVPNVEGLFTRLSFAAYRLSAGRLTGPLSTLYQVENAHMHLFHFSAATLRRLLERAGFEVLEIVQQDVVDVDNLEKRASLENKAWSRVPYLHLPVAAVFHLSRLLRLRDEIAIYARRDEGAQV